MAGKGDTNRSANRAYWESDYWKASKRKTGRKVSSSAPRSVVADTLIGMLNEKEAKDG